MKFFGLSKYYSLNILLYFSLVANILYVFYAIYLFNIKSCTGLLCVLDPFVYSLFYYLVCIFIVAIFFILLCIEYILQKSKKVKNNIKVIENILLKRVLFFIGGSSLLFLVLMFFTILIFLLNISANID